ncbi:hypothetical protein COLO4_36902 [Corchorus olitorius]|uniref:Uncharacterized protein n=1 Tax=Corchorus olitorius TaxID=93759 RepID=A0A1R3G4G6_9ROSI|nr:hypothetical protein COLO4_36902 [Corchorus olitorius]
MGDITLELTKVLVSLEKRYKELEKISLHLADTLKNTMALLKEL